jgi:hypothetical protein
VSAGAGSGRAPEPEEAEAEPEEAEAGRDRTPPGSAAPAPTPSTRERHGLTRRQLLGGAGGGVVALALAGLAGYEWPHPRPAPVKAKTPANEVQGMSFVSRPDLRPPRVLIRHHGSRLSGRGPSNPPYIFLAARTYLSDAESQPGLMVVDRRGALVWFRPLTTLAPFDFQVQEYQGRPVLTWWQGKVVNGYGLGNGELAGTDYKGLLEVRAGDGLQADLHELLLTSRGTALITAFARVSADLSSVGGPSHGTLLTGHAQEVDLATGKLLMDWDSLGHVRLDETYQKYSPGPFDYFHINSIAEAPDGNLIISARNTWAIYKVDRSSGRIMWRMNGKRSDFAMPGPARFYWQHDARPHGTARMTVFDDGATPSEERQSRGLLLSMDEAKRRVTLLTAFEHPAGFLSANQGNVQLLPDGRAFVGWGNQPYFSEFAPDGELLLDGELPIGYHSYRAYTREWSGRPTSPPDVAARGNPAGGNIVYASWNGATEVHRWVVLAGGTPGTLGQVGAQDKSGFETEIAVNSNEPYFAVVALDASGREIGRSAPVRSA